MYAICPKQDVYEFAFFATLIIQLCNISTSQTDLPYRPQAVKCTPPVSLSPFPVIAVVVDISTFCFLLLSDDWEELGKRTNSYEDI